ncbi:uncharacterized protein [Triticum aestivum]|uniref:uncharacterized protein n=1 Tax=Triticum aestivum TaxID=4565 RepID=UPI001D02D87A|nr:uncharacterized protein LOC123186838 [Triticum aestivum]
MGSDAWGKEITEARLGREKNRGGRRESARAAAVGTGGECLLLGPQLSLSLPSSQRLLPIPHLLTHIAATHHHIASSTARRRPFPSSHLAAPAAARSATTPTNPSLARPISLSCESSRRHQHPPIPATSATVQHAHEFISNPSALLPGWICRSQPPELALKPQPMSRVSAAAARPSLARLQQHHSVVHRAPSRLSASTKLSAFDCVGLDGGDPDALFRVSGAAVPTVAQQGGAPQCFGMGLLGGRSHKGSWRCRRELDD